MLHSSTKLSTPQSAKNSMPSTFNNQSLTPYVYQARDQLSMQALTGMSVTPMPEPTKSFIYQTALWHTNKAT